MNLILLLVTVLMATHAEAESLDHWVASHVRAEERILADALRQVNGSSLDLLKNASFYVPFFLEAPEGLVFASPEVKDSFDEWIKEKERGFLPGGYLFRLRFKIAPPLYALSGGDGEGTTWHCLALGKDLTIEPEQIWEAGTRDDLYATLLAGVSPRLLLYDSKGDLKKEEKFDLSAGGSDRQLEAVVSKYSGSGVPVAEMISMSEYLKSPDSAWRALDLAGHYNLLNQQERSAEQERFKGLEKLTRKIALGSLEADSSGKAASRTNSSPDAETTERSEVVKESKKRAE